MIYSFDIFDTLITRITGTPTGVFAIMQDTLIRNDTYQAIAGALRKNFYDARIHLEERARDVAQAEDITIVDIYNFMADVFGLSTEERDLLIALEIETEQSVIVGIDENIAQLKKRVKEGAQVILVSDMYLRKNDIIRLLDHVDPFISRNCDIFVSSELKKTKHRGTLYDHIIQYYNIKPSEIMHTGDNQIADIRTAIKKKIRTTYFGATKNSYYEDFIVNQKVDSMALQIMVGVSKLARMKMDRPIEAIGCSLAGPWVFAYVRWLLEQAKRDGIKKLYFLSRDGDILLQIAERIIAATGDYSDILLKYLCVSRHSTVYPSLNEIDGRAIDYILQKHPYLNLKMISQRVYVPEETLNDFFKEKYNLQLKGADLSKRVIKRITHIFKNDPDLQKILFIHRDEKRDLILKYFEQEGLFESDTIAIADIGWLCTIQDAMYHIIRSSRYKNKKLKGYYFGITSYTQDTNPYNQKIPFAFHPFAPDHIYNKPYYVILLELYCSSELDVTIDYDEKDGKLIVNQQPSKKIQSDWIASVRRGMIAYTDTMLEFETYSRLDFSMDVNRYMEIYYKPDRNLAENIGSIYYSADPFDSDIREFAPKFSYKNLLKPGYSKWPEGSLKRSDFINGFIRLTLAVIKHKLLQTRYQIKEMAKNILWKYMPL